MPVMWPATALWCKSSWPIDMTAAWIKLGKAMETLLNLAFTWLWLKPVVNIMKCFTYPRRLLSPALFVKAGIGMRGTLNSFICPSVCHINLSVAHIFWICYSTGTTIFWICLFLAGLSQRLMPGLCSRTDLRAHHAVLWPIRKQPRNRSWRPNYSEWLPKCSSRSHFVFRYILLISV